MSSRGLTLLETMVALAVLALLATLALPSFGSAAQRARLKAAAETLAADLSEARLEAAHRAQPLHVAWHGGADWCWAVATTPGCACGSALPCQLKAERAVDHPGIELAVSGSADLAPTGDAQGAAIALFASQHGEQLRVALSPLGRASICAPGAAVPGYARC